MAKPFTSAIVVLTLVAATSAAAQSCPADLTGISGQVQTPDIQAMLTTTMDTIIADDGGGLDQAIAVTDAKLSQMQATLQSLTADDDPATRLYVIDTITMFQAEISAMTCRRGR
jgi:hypothetical protein